MSQHIFTHEILKNNPIIWLVNLRSSIFWHFIDTNLTTKTISVVKDVFDRIDIESSILHQHTAEILTTRTIHIVIVHACSIFIPKETEVSHACKNAVILPLWIHLKSFREMNCFGQWRSRLNKHEDILFCKFRIVNILQHYTFCWSSIASILSRTTIKNSLLVVLLFYSRPYLIGICSYYHLIYFWTSLKSLYIPTDQRFAAERFDILKRNWFASASYRNECYSFHWVFSI